MDVPETNPDTAAGRTFEVTAPLRFAECDPAGIAFYPRLVERVNACVEDWFAGPVDYPFSRMHPDGEVGVPTRSLNVEFLTPGKLGEQLTLSLAVERLGRASIHLCVTGRLADGRTMFVARPVLVWCSFTAEGVRAAAIPEEVARRMRAFEAA